MKIRNAIGMVIFLLGAILFISNISAAAEPYGKWKVDPATTKSIESGKVLADHTYYYTGSINGPDCFIAISNHYKLRSSPVWAKMDEMNDKIMAGWLQSMKTQGGTRAFNLRGGDILTPDGKKAGVWYSHYTVNIIEMPSPGELIIYQPHPVGGSIPGQD